MRRTGNGSVGNLNWLAAEPRGPGRRERAHEDRADGRGRCLRGRRRQVRDLRGRICRRSWSPVRAVLLAAPLAIGGTVSTQQITGFDSQERSAVIVPVPPTSCWRWSRLTFHVGGGGTVPVVVGGTQGESSGRSATRRPSSAGWGQRRRRGRWPRSRATTVRPIRRRRPRGLRGSELGHRSHLLGRVRRSGNVGVHRSGPHQSTLHKDGNTVTPLVDVVTFRTDTT